MKELASQFNPKDIEFYWQELWHKNPFVANNQSDKPSFSIVMPPPNVTGSLHLGHAFDNSLIDTIIRYKRLKGFEVLYLPGTDHAGISTQVVVERQLKDKNINRYDLGREKFLEEVFAWKEQSGGQILGQLTKLGISADWSRERFTLDEKMSRAVRRQFVELYNKGLIYRGERMVNWDPVSQTTLSDLEILREEKNGFMYTLSYKLADDTLLANGERGEILIATVRPETIFADVAIAVHPDDEKFKHLVGQKAQIPLTNRFIPIIADEAVEMDFGVGALKITPAHDPTDFEIGERHNLDRPCVIDLNGNLCSDLVPEIYRNKERFEARKLVAKDLLEQGFLKEKKDYKISLGVSERTKAIVEPIISEQWFVRTKTMAEKVLKGLENKETKIFPERYLKINQSWLENIRDWNISRQLWWGHRIPAWYDEQGNIYLPDIDNLDLDPDQNPAYNHLKLKRDEDVFDTWFSSNLWPFSALGWCDSQDYKKFYPTDLLITGYDILFFWVARMQMAGYELTNSAPFKNVLLHGLYLDSKGQKMSKTKGNGIDPLELFEKYGVDACRFAFCYLSTGGQDIKHDDRRFEQGRNFANKLWNASRFVLMRIQDIDVKIENLENLKKLDLSLSDRWIISRFNETNKEVCDLLDQFEISAALKSIYTFIWDEFCDWYIEASKNSLENKNSTTAMVIYNILLESLKILHPFMPFITSELFKILSDLQEQIALTNITQYDVNLYDVEATKAFDVLRNVVNSARSLKNELGLAPQDKVFVNVESEYIDIIKENSTIISKLAKIDLIDSLSGKTLSQVNPFSVVKVPLEGTVDLDSWLKKQQKKLEEFDKQIKQAQNKLNNANFVAKAPREVVEEEKSRIVDFTSQQERLLDILKQF